MKKKRLKVFLVCGARPNFMKIAPVWREMQKYYEYFEPLIIHTGQHYDYELSKIFFEDFNLPEPDVYLGIGSGTHAEQTGKVMIEFENLLFKARPDLVIVVGDVNSTLACALATVKFRCTINSNYPLIAHVEAGLRSFDRTMPEEINRMLTDAISDLLFTPSPDADENLKKEGIAEDKIYLVGDIMVDSLITNKEKAKKSNILEELGLKEYAVLTLHRPSNVDNKEDLIKIISALKEVAQRIPIIYPAHPRAKKNIDKFGLSDYFIYWDGHPIKRNDLYIFEPLGYLDFICLEMNAKFVLTDSGGIQEETAVLGVPCLTLRNTTERPITLQHGTNTLVYNDKDKIVQTAYEILDGKKKRYKIYKLWDGKTAERIIKILIEKCNSLV